MNAEYEIIRQAEAAAPHILQALQGSTQVCLVSLDEAGKRSIQLIDPTLEQVRELFAAGKLGETYIFAKFIPWSFLYVESSWGDHLHYKHNTVDGKTYLRVCGEDEEPEGNTWEIFMPLRNLVEQVVIENNKCIQWPNDGYIGKPRETMQIDQLPVMAVSEKDLLHLSEYSHSFPTGTTIGKTWRSKCRKGEDEVWVIMRWVADPNSKDHVLCMALRAEIVQPEMATT